jgi:RecB family exonuclease
MGLKRHFLGSRQPALVSATDYIVDRYASAAELDLSSVLIVVPGARAARRLLELLTQRAGKRFPGLCPPRIVTFSVFPEFLYPPQKPFADDFTQLLVWRQALFSLAHSAIAAALPYAPDPDAIGAWTALCTTFRNQHRELAAEDSNFETVAQRLKQDGPAAEADRWQALARLQHEYHRCMDQLELWDQQTARLEAVRRRECQTDRDILLIATTDISRVVCRMLDQVADRVTVLIHADESHAEGFDGYGGLRPEYWEQQRLDLPRSACRITLNPLEQARQAVREIAAHNGSFRADQIVVGAADESLVPILLQQLADAGTSGRWPIGQLLRQTSPWRLLAAIAAHLATAHEELPPDFDSLSELVRHPDCGAWVHRHLQQSGGSDAFRRRAHFWLAELDAYRADHLQLNPGTFHGPQPRRDIVAEVCRAVERLLETLLPQTAGNSPHPGSTQLKSRRSLDVWATGVLRMFDAVYANSSQPLPNGCEECRDALQLLQEHLGALPEQILPRCSADQAIQLLLRQIADIQQAREIEADGIDLVGWLDLPLDDSPLLVLTGFNEGAVPQSMAGDAFLPDSLRSRLGIRDNSFRYARDACALHAILQSQRKLVVLFGRTSASGDPLSPSRLWFACAPEEIRHRIVWFHAEEDPSAAAGSDSHHVPAAAGSEATAAPESSLPRSHSRFTIPAPVPQPPPAAIPVTAFREYIACPYRYHLRRELGLKFVDGHVREIDALAFGNLVHLVLNHFGQSPLRNAHEPEAIQTLLIEQLRRLALEHYGRTRSATVNVQLRMLENRLIAFSVWQAAEARAGWHILHTEQRFECPEFTDAKDRKVLLHGRIDRIDRHQQTGEYRVIDYKTSEKANSPKATHRKGEDWIDLQLPLYRLLARAAGLEGKMQLGYVQLPGDTNKVGFDVADWEEPELLTAETLARSLAADILDRRIPDVAVDTAERAPELYRICQDTVIDRSTPWLHTPP